MRAIRVPGIDPRDVDGVDEAGVHAAGAHQGDADAVAAQVEPQHLRHAAQPELVALYGACQGSPRRPAADETLTTWPPRRARIIRARSTR